MKLCIRKDKITPDIPVLPMGFAARTHQSEGVHDDLYLSVVWLESDTGEAALLAAFDLIGADESFAQGLRQALCAQCGLEDHQIILSYSHTHAAVAGTGEDGGLRGGRVSIAARDFGDTDTGMDEDVRYFRAVRDKVVALVLACRAEAYEGELYFAKAECRFGVSRRHPRPDGGVDWLPYISDAARDTDLFALRFVDRAGALRGLLYSYACHPTTMGSDNYLLSAEYPGVVRRYVEEWHPGAQAVFIQGCGADIKPAKSGETGVFRGCSFDELEEAGRGLADELEALLSRPEAWRKLDGTVKIETEEIRLWAENWPRERWEQLAAEAPQEYRRRSARRALTKYDDGSIRTYLPYRMSCLRLDAGLCVLTMPQEVVSSIGKEIKEVWKSHGGSRQEVITCGYTNTVFCYIPTRQVLLQGGYEADSFLAAGITGPFVPEIEDIIVGHATLMIGRS